MLKLTKNELEPIFRFAVDMGTQLEDDRVLLTVLDIEQVAGEAVLDFHGTESVPARRVKRPVKRSSADSIGWWDLTQGVYVVTFNERLELENDHAAWLQPHEDITANGLWHPTIMVTDWDRDAAAMMLAVGARGVKMAESTVITAATVFTTGK